MNGAMLLPEFDMEMAKTRTTLERIPEDRLDFKPHEKSFTVHQLAAHLAEIPAWVPPTLTMDVFDMDAPWERVVPETREQILEAFDSNVAAARQLLEAATPEQLASTWSMKAGGEVTMSMPKGAVLRAFIFNHTIHHRAQLTVYLRLLDVPVPALYGPSADEQ